VDFDTAGLARGNYERLSVLLRGREGWRPEVEDGERIWCFGLHGAARLVITPEADGFLMYVHEEDRSWVIPRLELVEAWLTASEARFAGLTPLQEECMRALGQGPVGGGQGA
jgi:hypothetical protein